MSTQVRIRVQSWGVLRRRLSWHEQLLELQGSITVRDVLQMLPGLPAGAVQTGNDGDTLYEIMTRNDAIRVDKWLCINGRIQTDRAKALDRVLGDGDQLLVMEATMSAGG